MRARDFVLFLILPCLAPGWPSRVAASPGQIEAPQPAAAGREKASNDLLARLRQAPDAESAARIRAAIARLWSRSGSPTADLLMSRAESLLHSGQAALGATLLDRIVMLYPDWSLGWRRRAQSAFAQGDHGGAMLDLDHALAVEPRDFMAMVELASLLRADGRDAKALELLRRVLEIDPQNADVRREAEKVEREIEGQRI